MGIIRSYFPKPLQAPMLKALPLVKKGLHFGFNRYCPICDSHVRYFKPTGVFSRPDAVCPVCKSGERHRLAWLFLDREYIRFIGKKILHIAPEETIAKRLKGFSPNGYLSADINESRAMVKMDITQINYSDKMFNIIYCSHVLEHVSDDLKALREFHRVLADDGFAVIQVPILGESTFEDPTVTDPKERERLFGQHDHVRRYGPDIKQRIEKEGFSVKEFASADFKNVKNSQKMALKNLSIFFCEKI